jgi:integrase
MELATADDPIAKMIWGLQPDNKTRYPPRLKVVTDYFGFSKAEDDDKEALRIAAVQFMEIAKQKPEWVEDRLMEFITSQELRVENEDIKPVSIRNYIKAVKRFCDMNRINLSRKLVSKGIPSGRTLGDDRAPTAEELITLIGDDLRLKLIVTIMSSCGIRIGAWKCLKKKHITPITVGNVTLAAMKVYAGQHVGKRKEYWTLISSEAYQTFQMYLARRSAAGEMITGESWVVRDIWKTTNISRDGYYGVEYR